jgi:hypothetical protein
MLELASPEVLSAFLRRVETELLPRGEFTHAEKLLIALLKLPKVKADSVLRDTATALLERALTPRHNRRKLIEPVQEVVQTFPHASAQYRLEDLVSFVFEVREARCLFAF